KGEVAWVFKLGRVPARRPNRARCSDRKQTSGRSCTTGGRQRKTRSGRHAEDCRSTERRVPSRVVGLGFLFRKSSQGALRLRRIGAASVLRAEPCDHRWRLFCRRETLRSYLQGTS